jgi:hypothetical protein
MSGGSHLADCQLERYTRFHEDGSPSGGAAFVFLLTGAANNAGISEIKRDARLGPKVERTEIAARSGRTVGSRRLMLSLKQVKVSRE